MQPIDIAGIYKINNILTNEKTNRALRVFQPFSRYYRRIILQDEFLSAGWVRSWEGGHDIVDLARQTFFGCIKKSGCVPHECAADRLCYKMISTSLFDNDLGIPNSGRKNGINVVRVKHSTEFNQPDQFSFARLELLFVNIPNNEGMACDAVIRHLEKWIGETRVEIRHPESDGVGPPVDLRLQLGNRNYAIEHTRIESFDNQIKAGISIGELNKFIKERFTDPLPGPVYYELRVPMDICLPEKRKERERMLSTLDKWIRESAHCMHGRNTDLFRPIFAPIRSEVWHDDYVIGAPLGPAYEIKLVRTKLWPPDIHTAGRKPGTIVLWYNYPDEDETNRRHFRRLQRAFDKKYPKLKRCKDEGARTVLVLEAVDSIITLTDQIGRHLPALLDGRKDAMDDIYLVKPGDSLWWVFPVKHDDDHWPDVGMPPPGQAIYQEGISPTAGMPKWYRDGLGLDDLYTTMPRKWFPDTFDQHELDDLTHGRVSEM